MNNELSAYAKTHNVERWEIKREDGTVEVGLYVEDSQGFTVALLVKGVLEFVSHGRAELMEEIQENYAEVVRIHVS